MPHGTTIDMPLTKANMRLEADGKRFISLKPSPSRLTSKAKLKLMPHVQLLGSTLITIVKVNISKLMSLYQIQLHCTGLD